MENFFSDCLDRFDSLHKDIKKNIHGMPMEALDWLPAGETNSISVLVTHMAAAEKFWAVDIASGNNTSRVRSEEFAVKRLSEEELISSLDDALDQMEQAFEKLTLADLGTMRHSNPHRMDVTVAWAILHALEHTALHVGHIQLTAQLWAQKSLDQ